MRPPKLADPEFIAMFREIGPTELATQSGVNIRNVMSRRRKLEGQLGITIDVPLANARQSATLRETIVPTKYPQRAIVEIRNGMAFVASDFHYWPGEPSVIHRAIVKLAKEFKPTLFVANGDVIDGAAVSRHAPIGWEKRPKLIEEIEAAQDRLHEIISALPRGARTVWDIGNHDQRFETRIATVAPEYAKIKGVHLHDHFPGWESAWSCWINDSVVVKHRYRGGIHATRNNTLAAGRSIVTGHLHSAKVSPLSDYNGTRYGVDTGCVADVEHSQFVDYTEDGPKDWRSGFGILTFRDGRLLYPELVLAWDEKHVQFRGDLIEV